MMARILSGKHNPTAQWRLKPAWADRAQLARQLHLPPLLAQLLYNRGIKDADHARRFLQPSLNDLIEPKLLVGIDQAVRRIRRAIADNEKIVLYGDYDVDGITGVAVLWRCLKLIGREVEFYVPHRIDQGYGLNEQALRQLADRGAQLIITVDCGITAVAQAQVTAELGVDLIITDHHHPEGPLPAAVSIVHPNLPGQDYPNHHLCGSGVAFKLAWALAQDFCGAQKVTPEFREFLLSATALAALGTIADVVDLRGENRVLAVYGMRGLTQSTDTGITALMKASGLTGAVLQSSDVAFRLAPRLNAAGRMGHARLAIELFTNSTPARAEQIATYLESQNRLRQKVEKEITSQATQQVTALGMDKAACRGIVAAAANWHAGVIGIVASRLVDRHHRPAIVISIQGDRAIGSCRSVRGFDIYLALHACAEHLISFGGHSMAAGLTLKPDKIDTLRGAFNEYATDNLSDEQLCPVLNVDAAVSLGELNVKTVEMIERLGPFGEGNPAVLLLAQPLRLVGSPRVIGKSADHLQLTVAAADNAQLRPGSVMRAVAFGKAKWAKKLIDADAFALVFTPAVNHFNGNTTVELIVRDIRLDPLDPIQ